MTAGPMTDDALALLAATVHEQHRRATAAGRRAIAAHAETLDAQLATGHALLKARSLLPSDRAFGAWFAAQRFPFVLQWGWVLREAARDEGAVRAVVATQLATGRLPNVSAAVAEARGRGPSAEPAVARRQRQAAWPIERLIALRHDLAGVDPCRVVHEMLADPGIGYEPIPPADEARDLRGWASLLRGGIAWDRSLADALDVAADALDHVFGDDTNGDSIAPVDVVDDDRADLPPPGVGSWTAAEPRRPPGSFVDDAAKPASLRTDRPDAPTTASQRRRAHRDDRRPSSTTEPASDRHVTAT